MGWASRFLQTSNIIIYASSNNRLLSRLPWSSFHQLVSMTSRLNRLLCCVITQARKASKHAVFSFGEADMGGARMGKECPNLLCKALWGLGQEAWFKIGMKLLTRYSWYLESWGLSQFEHTYMMVCHWAGLNSRSYTRVPRQCAEYSTESERLSCCPVPWQIAGFHFLSFLSSLLPLSTDGSSSTLGSEWRGNVTQQAG